MPSDKTAAAISILQKTYDESYLTCSTAIYFESQGNEREALRYWRQALERISTHNASNVLPPTTRRQEAERALADSLHQLELQCKERIDLLEALRLSREEARRNSAASFGSKTPKSRSGSPDKMPHKKQDPGYIGDGTIPAVKYADLPRPDLASRTPNRSRSSSKKPTADTGVNHSDPVSPSPLRRQSSSAPVLPSSEKKLSKASSPERHILRTTLRPAKTEDKPAKLTTKRSKDKTESRPGASKAAVLAWISAEQQHASGVQTPRSSQELPRSVSSPPVSTDQILKKHDEERRSLERQRLPSAAAPLEGLRQYGEGLQNEWDRTAREMNNRFANLAVAGSPAHSPGVKPDKKAKKDLTGARRPEDILGSRPDPLSISAASSALNSLSLRTSNGQPSPTAPVHPSPHHTRRKSGTMPGFWDLMMETTIKDSRPTPKKTMTDPALVVSQRSASKGSSGTKDGLLSTPSGKTTSGLLDGSSKKEPSFEYVSRSASRAHSPTLDAILSPPSGKVPFTPLEGNSRKDAWPETISYKEPRPEDSRRRVSRSRRPSFSNPTFPPSAFQTPDKLSRPRRKSDAQFELSPSTNSTVQSPVVPQEEEIMSPADKWKRQREGILKKLPPGVDPKAAKQILNEVVVQGDEVHWSDIAGLEVAKSALRETVVYPFLRPDLFKGLREPARGMLLFGPPGTGKTMLARAVATESKSTFFSISASSLTSKWLGESEKLVRALFALAKVLAPSIIFVDEIDSLLTQRSGRGDHESTLRIKTEFLIQWSDLQRAAAGREVEGVDANASRVLVLAATNLPWAIDEAARRRFVRRQYIPLPEPETRAMQIKTLLKQQKHTLTDADIETLVGLTDGFSGSDITALAKDAAMGPLRSVGDALLHMSMDEIRPIELSDFVASLSTIRPSVSKSSIKKYEDWAKEFGERGG